MRCFFMEGMCDGWGMKRLFSLTRQGDNVHTSAQRRGMVPLCCWLACEETNEVHQDEYFGRPVAVKSCKINQIRESETERSVTGVTAVLGSANESRQRLETRWVSSVESSQLAHVWSHWGSDHKPAAVLSFVPLCWPEMKVWLVASNPHSSVQSSAAQQRVPSERDDRQHRAQLRPSGKWDKLEFPWLQNQLKACCWGRIPKWKLNEKCKNVKTCNTETFMTLISEPFRHTLEIWQPNKTLVSVHFIRFLVEFVRISLKIHI